MAQFLFVCLCESLHSSYDVSRMDAVMLAFGALAVPEISAAHDYTQALEGTK